MQRPGTRALWSAGLMAALAGCVGNISDLDSHDGSPSTTGAGGGQHAGNGSVPGGGSFPVGGSSSTGPGGAGSSAGTSSAPTTHTLPLRRLTPFELDNALRELTGDTSGAALELRPGKSRALLETNTTDNQLNLDALQTLESIAYAAAKGAAQNPDSLLGCSPTAAGDACVQGFVRSFGRRAFRRSLSETEVSRYTQLESTLEAKYGRPEAVTRTVQAFLLSPYFLYLTSFGVNDAAGADTGPDAPLEGHELASRLSFFLWASLPDEALLAAADQGALATPAQVAAQVDRMLSTPFEAKAANAAARFVAGWLGILDLTRQAKNDPAWSPALVRSMLGETDTLVKDWFVKGESGIAGLVEADYSFIDENLAALYGVGGVSGGAPVRVQITEVAKRRGVMAHASVLAAHSSAVSSSPVHRGQWLLERVLCAPSPPPPNNASALAPTLTADMTTREWNQAIVDKGGCGGCHERLAPPGFLFEDFDPLGRHRDTDNQKPAVTATTLATGIAEIDGAAADHQSLATRLAASDVLPACAAEQWLGYALALNTDLDGSTKAKVTAALKTSAREAMRAIATSDDFRLARRNASTP